MIGGFTSVYWKDASPDTLALDYCIFRIHLNIFDYCIGGMHVVIH